MALNYTEELNESQLEAVMYNDGPSLVIAGAGSGKTRVLTYKIAYLLDVEGYVPWSILALTFTNKAAREMKERIAGLVGEERARFLWMGTFHSIFSRILRIESDAVGFPSNFTIYDAADSKSLVKGIIKEMNLDEKAYNPAAVAGRISAAKNRLLLPDAYGANAETVEADTIAKMPLVRDIYVRYWERCRQSGVMDFDDLLLYTYLLLYRNPEICAKYAGRFRFMLVDEYQDTNFAQHAIVQLLTKGHKHVCVVGDDAQSIYSFRGANIDNILAFGKIYPDTRIFKLERNYRSTKNIVEAAGSLIAKNHRQIYKEVFSENSKGELISVERAFSDTEEAVLVGRCIQNRHSREGCSYDDFAILYRTNAQSRVFEEELRKREIPYRIYGGLSFYQRKEVKDVIAYFRLAVNPNDEEALKRVINYPARGIGDTTLSKIIATANDNGLSLWTVIGDPAGTGLKINKGTAAKLRGFHELIDSFIGIASEKNAHEAGVDIVRLTGIMQDLYNERTPESVNRIQNIEELANGIQAFCEGRTEEGNRHISLSDFLADVSLMTDQDTDEGDDGARVSLMTIHSAKGLEFNDVFVVGLEENLFPSPMSGGTERGLEEERRLLYVAITRAKKRCSLSYAQCRYRYGKMETNPPSRFLKDIDARYLDFNHFAPASSGFGVAGSTRIRTTAPAGSSLPWSTRSHGGSLSPERLASPQVKAVSLKSSEASAAAARYGISEGCRVRHARFGDGTVKALEYAGDDVKATVDFDDGGSKKLLLKYARLKVIN